MTKKLTFAIPVLNEERNIKACLEGIFNQNYPVKGIEVFIVDAGCTDNTIKIAKTFPVKFLDNSKRKDYDTGKMLALKKATGDYFMYLDADMFLNSKDWIKKMLAPFKDKRISGTFTKFVVMKGDNSLNRYLSYDSLQRDPLYKFLTPNISEIVIEKNKDFQICKLRLNNPPPIGLCIFRTKVLKEHFKGDRLIDMEVPLTLFKKGHKYLGYVPSAGVLHKHVKNIRHLLRKRFRNINIMKKGDRGLIPDYENRLFKWVDFNNKREVVRLCLWVIYANLFVPLLLTGIYKSLKHRDSAFLLEPIIGLAVTDIVVLGFIMNRKGRKLIFGKIK